MKGFNANLTKRERDRRTRAVLVFIREYVATFGAPPTLEEISNHIGKSKSVVWQDMSEMQRQGLIKRHGKRLARALTITPLGQEFINTTTEEGDRL